MNILKAILLTTVLASSQSFACDFASIMPRNTGEVNPVSGKVITEQPTKNSIVCDGLIVANAIGMLEHKKEDTLEIDLIDSTLANITIRNDPTKIHIISIIKVDGFKWKISVYVSAYRVNTSVINSYISVDSNCNQYKFYNEHKTLEGGNNYASFDGLFPQEWITSNTFGIASDNCGVRYAMVPDKVKDAMRRANTVATLAQQYHESTK